MNLIDLVDQFRNEDKCRAYLEGLRWPDGPKCLRCEGEKVSRIETRKLFECLSCGYQFSVTVGSVFADTHLPLWKWFAATYLMGESKKGISSNQLKRTLGVSYKTAWYLTHRIRVAYTAAAAPLLTGIVEVDETWVGGKVRGKGHGYRKNKTMVMGAVQRGGEVRLKVEKRADRKTLHTFIKTVVDDGAVAIHTDEWPAYLGIADRNTRHETVNHRQEEWVRADVHTNTVEGVWSLLKRSIVGSYHQLSEKHLEAYADEVAFKFNNRQNPYWFRDTILNLLKGETLRYAELTASN